MADKAKLLSRFQYYSDYRNQKQKPSDRKVSLPQVDSLHTLLRNCDTEDSFQCKAEEEIRGLPGRPKFPIFKSCQLRHALCHESSRATICRILHAKSCSNVTNFEETFNKWRQLRKLTYATKPNKLITLLSK